MMATWQANPFSIIANHHVNLKTHMANWTDLIYRTLVQVQM